MTEFKEGKPCKRCGGTKRYTRGGECAFCRAAYRATNRDKLRAIGAAYLSTPQGKAGAMWRGARERARSGEMPFTITPEYVRELVREYGFVCPALGTPFQIGMGKPIPESMTLDRFDPALGYVPGNVWLLSHKANMIKSTATRTELGRVYRWMCKVIGEQTEGENQ